MRKGGHPHTPSPPQQKTRPIVRSLSSFTDGNTLRRNHPMSSGPVPGPEREGGPGPPPSCEAGGVYPLRKKQGGGVCRRPPLLKNENGAHVHGRPGDYERAVSVGRASFLPHSFPVRGGLSGPEGGRGLPETSPPWGVGGFRAFSRKWAGGSSPDPPHKNMFMIFPVSKKIAEMVLKIVHRRFFRLPARVPEQRTYIFPLPIIRIASDHRIGRILHVHFWQKTGALTEIT